MALDRRLEYEDTWVYEIVENVDTAITIENLYPLFVDQNTPIQLQVSWSQAEYTRILSAMMLGAELNYPYQAQQIYYDFLKVQDRTLSCEEIIDCLQNDPDTANAVLQFLAQNGYGTGSGNADTPIIHTNNPLVADGSAISGCNNDNLFGGITQLVDLMHTTLTDIFEQIEALSNYIERTSLLISGAPAIGLLPIDEFVEFADQVISALAENYNAQYNATLRDEYRCDLFCLCKDTCEMDFRTFADYFMGRVGAVISNENISDAVEWFITGVWEGEQVVHAAHAIICNMLAYGSRFFSIDMAWLSRVVTSSMNDPDSDWTTLCEECLDFDYPNLVTTRCQDALNLGAVTQIDANHWHCVSEVHSDSNSYLFLRDDSISAAATFKILALTNKVHASGSENGSQTSATCVINNVFSWTPGQIGALNRYEYMFSSNVAFSFDIEVSEIGAV